MDNDMDNKEFLYSLAIENLQLFGENFSHSFKGNPEIEILNENVISLDDLKANIPFTEGESNVSTQVCKFNLKKGEDYIDLFCGVDQIETGEAQAESFGKVILKLGGAPNPSWSVNFKFKAQVIPEIYEIEPESATTKGKTAYSSKEITDWFVVQMDSLLRMIR